MNDHAELVGVLTRRDIHERIERLVAGPYLELFARQSRPGWTTWGNEATKFDSKRHTASAKEAVSTESVSSVLPDA